MLTFELAKTILPKRITEEHLFKHSLAVSAAMRQMARHFGQDEDHWAAIGYLHDIDFEKYPDEHCHHVRQLLEGEDVSEEDIRAIISHGWGLTIDVKPESDMEKSLFTVDELTGIVMAASLMRPNGILDLEVKSVKKKFKDRRFAAGCDRDVIVKGCELLGMDLADVMALTIEGMRAYASELSLEGTSGGSHDE